MRKNIHPLSRLMKVAGITAACVGFSAGILGGFCDLALRFAPTIPDVQHGFTEAKVFRDQIKFISIYDNWSCNISDWTLIAAFAVSVLMAVGRYAFFHDLPHH